MGLDAQGAGERRVAPLVSSEDQRCEHAGKPSIGSISLPPL